MGKSLSEIKKEIFNKAEIEYHKHWLIHYGLKVGDKVKCRFPSNWGTRKQAWVSSTDCEAIIKKSYDGTLFLESTIPIKHSINVNNGRSGRSRRDWWEYRLSIDRVDVENMIIPDEGGDSRN